MDVIRTQGAAALVQRQAVEQLVTLIDGSVWGTIKGSNLSPAAKTALAHYCYVAGIEVPQEELDFLGGPYRNAKHWTRKMVGDPLYIDHSVTNIINDPEKRADWDVPAFALAAYEIEIRSLVSFAPVDKIRRGEITDISQFIRVTRECNWAPSKKSGDPVGTQDPGKTARTRTVRRGAEKAFPATIGARVRRDVEIIEAEWEDISAGRKQLTAALPSAGESQAVASGAGEPMAASSLGATPLPVEDLTGDTQEIEDWTPEQREAARGGYFAALTAARRNETESRKAWQHENGLPESYNSFTRADYDRAIKLLLRELHNTLNEGLSIIGFDSLEVFCQLRNVEEPRSVKELRALIDRVSAEADGEV